MSVRATPGGRGGGSGWRLLAGLLGAAVASAAEPRRDVVYGEAGGERLPLDAHVPEGAGPFPVLILVHGGGWTGGDKAGDIALLAEPLSSRGFVCLSS